jgi:hypothetical protein
MCAVLLHACLLCVADVLLPCCCPPLQGIRHLEAHRHELALPVYVVHGTKDAVTDMNVRHAPSVN